MVKPPGEIMSFGVSPVNYSDSAKLCLRGSVKTNFPWDTLVLPHLLISLAHMSEMISKYDIEIDVK